MAGRNWQLRSWLAFSLAVAFFAIRLASTQNSAQAAGEGAATGAATSSAEFNRLFAQWKETLAQLRLIQEKFQLASPGDKPALEKEFDAKLAEGKKLAPQLLSVAEKAYAESPKTNKQAGDFIHKNLLEEIRNDNYEPALLLAKMLIAGGYEDPKLASMKGVAEYCTNDFASAKTDLLEAKKNGALDKNGGEYLEHVDQYSGFWQKEQKIREAEAKADDLPRIKFTTSKGDIVIELFENEAPIAVGNIISLVEKKFYDGVKFHRVIAGFMAQGGDPTGTGSGGPGYNIPCECYQDNARKHFRGSLSMAHAGKDTGGSQFFLTFVPTSHLNGKHTVFGRVVEGMDVLSKLERTEPKSPNPVDRIISAKVVRKRNHEYKPTKVGER